MLSLHEDPGDSLLISTLISENPGLQKSRSVSNHETISGPASLDLFRSPSRKKLGLYCKLEKNPGDRLKTNPGLQDLEQDLIFHFFRNIGADEKAERKKKLIFRIYLEVYQIFT